jgi:hypothetical protein
MPTTKMGAYQFGLRSSWGLPTQLASSVSDIGFVLAVTLEEGLSRTLCYEFMEDNSDKRTFETE